MVEREETVTVERTETYYECDKCHGRNHDETQNEHMLNKVVFGAMAHQTATLPANTFDAHNGGMTTGSTEPTVSGEHEYLLCEE